MELQKKYYNSIVENYSIHCENGSDYNSFKNLINNNLCFQKADSLIIDKLLVKWCFYSCISKYWNTKLINDLLLPVNIENLILNNFDIENTKNNIFEFYYFENYYDFLNAKDEFLNDFKYSFS